MLLGDQEHVQVGAQRTAHVREKEVDGIERARMGEALPGGFGHWFCIPVQNDSQALPSSSVTSVSGAPTRK